MFISKRSQSFLYSVVHQFICTTLILLLLYYCFPDFTQCRWYPVDFQLRPLTISYFLGTDTKSNWDPSSRYLSKACYLVFSTLSFCTGQFLLFGVYQRFRFCAGWFDARLLSHLFCHCLHWHLRPYIHLTIGFASIAKGWTFYFLWTSWPPTCSTSSRFSILVRLPVVPVPARPPSAKLGNVESLHNSR